MDVPLNVDVRCADGECGRSETIIVNPLSNEVTHVIVKYRGDKYMVPLDFIVESTPKKILLRCTMAELVEERPFVRSQFIGQDTDENYDDNYRHLEGSVGAEENTMLWPYSTVEGGGYLDLFGTFEQVPHGQLAIHRGARVEASDGHIGHVDEFLVNPVNHHISHLVLHENRLMGRNEYTISISEIDRIEEDTVYLKLDKDAVRALPSSPARVYHLK